MKKAAAQKQSQQQTQTQTTDIQQDIHTTVNANQGIFSLQDYLTFWLLLC